MLRFVTIALQVFFNVLNASVFLETTQNRDNQLSRNFSTEQPQQEDNGHIFVFSLKVHSAFPFGILYFISTVFSTLDSIFIEI